MMYFLYLSGLLLAIMQSAHVFKELSESRSAGARTAKSWNWSSSSIYDYNRLPMKGSGNALWMGVVGMSFFGIISGFTFVNHIIYCVNELYRGDRKLGEVLVLTLGWLMLFDISGIHTMISHC